MFKLIDKETIEKTTEGWSDTETLVRCGERGQIAGIGRNTDPPGLTKSLDTAFSAYYALALPEYCKDLEVDRKKADQLCPPSALMRQIGRVEEGRVSGSS
jgi:hypothetical protein